MNERSFDVVIVGLGPVGATIANLLGARGLTTLVIDKATEVNRAPRAIALDNEALRVLQLAGLPEGAFDTIAIPYVQMRSPIYGNYARANTTGQIDGHPKLVTFFQPQLEEALRTSLRRHATVEVRLGVELTHLEQAETGVALTLRQGQDEQRVEARFVVACDGATSFVRKALGLEFEGRTWMEDWLVVDVRGAPEPIDHVEFHCDHRRASPHMPAPGDRQRWEFKLRRGETREQMERPEVVRGLLEPWTKGAPVELERVAVYRFHARLAARFSKNRVFLAGDAAHLTPPFAGQGLVAGLRDAANLSWKLAAVVQGHASREVLESYTTERRPHAAATIDMALLMGRMVMPGNLAQALAVHGLARLLDVFPPTRRLFGELEIKPVHGSKEGLFHRGPSGHLQAGTIFGQSLVRREQQLHLSDEALGTGFSLVGFGVDALERVGAQTRARWQAIGGRGVQLVHRGQRLNLGARSERWEDVSGRFLSASGALGWAAVVRPDRIVLCEGPAAESEALVERALTLLGAPTTSTNVS